MRRATTLVCIARVHAGRAVPEFPIFADIGVDADDVVFVIAADTRVRGALPKEIHGKSCLRGMARR